MNDYEPPKDEQAERQLLGTLMHYPKAYTDAADLVDHADFYRPVHQLIWDVLTQRIAEQGTTHEAVNPVAIVHAIETMGQGHVIRNGDVVFDISNQPLTGGVVAEIARIVADVAELRRKDQLRIAIGQAVHARADPAVIDDLIAGHLETGRQRTHRSTTSSAILNWDAFFATDFGTADFLAGRILAEGQQIALVGDGKAGKSLFCQEWAWRMATGQRFLGDRAHDAKRVLYIDAENGHDEIQRRYVSFGAGPGAMGELRYASFPPLPPLDTPAGGLALMALVKDAKAEVVFIDTVSRFIGGVENDADTWLGLYRNTLMLLKRAGVASVRLDHFGKDRERGSRGSSAKTQDIDHVWELTAQPGGLLALKRTHSRTGIGEDHFAIRRLSQRLGDTYVPGRTRHELAASSVGVPVVPGSVEDIVERLDRAGVPSDWGRDRVQQKGLDLGITAAKAKWEEVVRLRKNRSGNLPADLPYSQVAIDGDTCPDEEGRLP